MRKFNPKKLRQIRESWGLTQRKLARLVKLSPAYISDLERGKTYPSIPTLESLAEIFKVPVSYFFEDSEQSENKTKIQETNYPDIETFLQKVLSGEIPIHFQGVDKLTPEVEEDIRTIIRVALNHIQLQLQMHKEQEKKAETSAKGVMKWSEYFNKGVDDLCFQKESSLTSVRSSRPTASSAWRNSRAASTCGC